MEFEQVRPMGAALTLAVLLLPSSPSQAGEFAAAAGRIAPLLGETESAKQAVAAPVPAIDQWTETAASAVGWMFVKVIAEVVEDRTRSGADATMGPLKRFIPGLEGLGFRLEHLSYAPRVYSNRAGDGARLLQIGGRIRAVSVAELQRSPLLLEPGASIPEVRKARLEIIGPVEGCRHYGYWSEGDPDGFNMDAPSWHVHADAAEFRRCHPSLKDRLLDRIQHIWKR